MGLYDGLQASFADPRMYNQDSSSLYNYGTGLLPVDSGEDLLKQERARELQRKIAMRTGELQYENDGSLIHDSNAMIRAKEAANAVSRGADWLLEASENIADFGQGEMLDRAQFDAENQGKRYSMSNKDFIAARNTTTKELIDQYHNAKHDPNAGGTVYTLKKFDGYNPDGTEKFLYKTGFAEVGANDRYNFKGIAQDIQDGYEIVEEKRFTGAEEWEKTWNASEGVLDARTLDVGGVQTPDGKYVSRDKASGVNFGDGYTELLNKDLLGVDEGKTQADYDKNREYSERLTNIARARYKAGMTDSVVGALASGTVSLLVDTADFILDVVTPGDNTMLNDVKKKENIDKWVGYDRTKSTQVLTDAATNWKNGNYFDAITGVLTDPNTMAESLPMMIGMTVGTGKFTAASRLLKATEKARQTGASVQHIAKLENRARKLMTAKEISKYEKYQNNVTLIKTLDHFAKNSGFHTVVGAMTNNVLDDRIAEKLKAGEDPDVDMFEVASVYATQLVLLSIDKMAFSKATGITGEVGALKKAFKSLTKSEQKPIISKLVAKASAIGAAGGVEGVQEYIQTWGEILGANVGVGGKTVSDVLSDEDKQQEARMGGLGGIGAGAQMRAVVETPGTFKDVNQAIDDKTYKTLSDNDLKFSNQASDIQIADLKALNDEAMNRIQEIRTELKSGPDEAKTQELKNLIQTRKENSIAIKERELSKDKTSTESKIKTDSDVDLSTTNIKDITETSKIPGFKSISQGLNNRAVTKELEKYSTEKLRKAVTALSSKEPTKSSTKTLEMLNKVIAKREKGESKVFTQNPISEDIAKLKDLTGKDRVASLTNILSNNTKLPDQEAYDSLKSIINDTDSSVRLNDKAKEMYSKRLETIKSLGFGVDEKTTTEPEVEPETTSTNTTEEATEEVKPTEPTTDSNEENKGTEEQPEATVNELADIDKLTEVELGEKFENFETHKYKNTTLSKVTESKSEDIKASTDKLLRSQTLSVTELGKLSQSDQYNTLHSAIKNFNSNSISQDSLTNSIKNSSISTKARDVLLSYLKSATTERGAMHNIPDPNVELKSTTKDLAEDDRDPNEKISRNKSGLKKIKQSEKRVKQYVTEIVTDEAFEDVLERGAISTKSANNKAHNIQEKSWNMLDTDKEIIRNLTTRVEAAVDKGELPMFPKSDPLSVPKAMRLAILSISGVLKNMRSNIDRTQNSTDKDAEMSTHYATKQDTLKEIGRSFTHSYGQEVVAKEGTKDNAVSSYHIKIGDTGIKLLNTLGYLSEYNPDDGSGITHYALAERKDVGQVKVTPDMSLGKDDVILLKEEFQDVDKNDRSFEASVFYKSKFDTPFRPILAALNPSSSKTPSTTKPKGPVRSDGNENSSEQSSIIKDIRSEPLEIDNEFYGLLTDIVETLRGRTTSSLGNSEKDIWIKNFFGLNIEKSGLEITREEEIGQLVSRQGNADSILDYIRELENNDSLEPYEKRRQFFEYFSARNNRIHLENIALDFQADKIVSRFILNTRHTTNTKEENLVVLANLADTLSSTDFEITVDDILSPSNSSEESKALEDILTHYSNNGIRSLLSSEVYNGEYTKKILQKGDSVAEIITAIQGIIDVRNAVKAEQEANPDKDIMWSDLKITTNFNPEFDASASGIVNKIANFQGYIGVKAKSEVVDGESKSDKDRPTRLSDKLDELTLGGGDAYLALIKEVMNIIDKRNSLDLNDTTIKKKNKATSAILKFIANVEGDGEFDINNPDHKRKIRDTAKYPVMTNSYGQKIKSLIAGLGKEIGIDLMKAYLKGSGTDKANAEAVFKSLDIKLEDVKDTNASFKMVSSKVGANFGTIFSDGLKNINADLNAVQGTIDKAYEVLTSARSFLRSSGVNHIISMRNPLDVTLKATEEVLGDIDPDTNFSIEKLMLTEQDMTKIAEDAGVVPTKLMSNVNKNSASVVALHAIDSAILLIAFKRTFKYFKDKGIYKGLGSIAIHDAVKGSPEFLLKYKEFYHEATLDVAQYYDILSEMEIELEYTLEQVKEINEGSSEVGKLEKAIKNITINKDKRLASKEAKIEELRANKDFSIFGKLPSESEMPSGPIDTTNYKVYKKRDFGKQSDASKDKDSKSEALERIQKEQRKAVVSFAPDIKSVVPKKKYENSPQHYKELKSLVASGEPYIVMSSTTSGKSLKTKEITSLTASIYKDGKQVGEDKTLTLLPSNEFTYELALKRDNDGSPSHKELETSESLKGQIGYDYTSPDGTVLKGMTRGQVKSSKAIDDFMTSLNKEAKDLDETVTNVPLVGYDLANNIDLVLKNTSEEYSKQDFKVIDVSQGFHEYNKITNTDGKYNPNKPTEVSQDTMAERFADKDTTSIAQLSSIVNNFGEVVKKDTNSFIYDFQQALKSKDKALKVSEGTDFLNSIEDTDEETKVYIENIKSALNSDNSLVSGKAFKFNPNDEQIFVGNDITFSDTKSFLKYIDHEVQHSVTAEYIRNQFFMESTKQSNAFKVLSSVFVKFKNKLPDILDDTKGTTADGDILGQSLHDRFEYIHRELGNGEDDSKRVAAMSEFVAIYRSNQEFRDYLSNNATTQETESSLGIFSDRMVKHLMKSIKDILSSAYKAITGKELSNITVEVFNRSLENIIFESSKEGGKPKPDNQQEQESLGTIQTKNTKEILYTTIKNVQEGCE